MAKRTKRDVARELLPKRRYRGEAVILVHLPIGHPRLEVMASSPEHARELFRAYLAKMPLESVLSRTIEQFNALAYKHGGVCPDAEGAQPFVLFVEDVATGEQIEVARLELEEWDEE